MLRKALFSIAIGAAALALGTSPSQAAEIDLGGFTASAAGCTYQGSGPGSVCGSTLTFTGTAAGTLTATGLVAGNPATAGTAFLTFKPTSALPNGNPANPLSESGLGQNTSGPGTNCSDIDCEIAGGINGASVLIQSSIALSEADVRVGSAQPNEAFNVYTGSSKATLALVASIIPNAVNCPGDICTINFAPTTFLDVQNNSALGDVLLTSVSTPAVPEPASLLLLGAGLLGLGAMRRRLR